MVRAYSSHRLAKLGRSPRPRLASASPVGGAPAGGNGAGTRRRRRSSLSDGGDGGDGGDDIQSDSASSDGGLDRQGFFEGSMTELERLVEFFEAEARGEEPTELTPSQIHEEYKREEEMRQRRIQTATASSRERTRAEDGRPGVPPRANLLSRPPRRATPKKKEAKGGASGVYISIFIAILAVYLPLHQRLSGLGLIFSAGAGCVVGVILVKSILGVAQGDKSSRSKADAEQLRRASNGLKARHRGEHDAVGNRTFPLRKARVQVLDVRVMEGSYATYRITVACQGQSWDVWHRYAEFDVLRHSLENSRVLPDIVPKLPPKTFGHRFDQTFLIQRKEKLRAFMTALMQYPHICDRDDVRRFLLMPPLPHNRVATDEMPYPGRQGTGWLRRLVGGSSRDDTQPAEISTEEANAEATPLQAGDANPASGNSDPYEAETGDSGPVRMWKSPFRSSTIREILDEFSDAGPDNEFVVRGLKYCTKEDADYKKKVKAGPALCELLHADIFAVDEDQYPERRHFHIAARGMAAERVAFLQSMPSQPFLFVFNLQIPGDPPVSMVNYFGIPRSLLETVSIDDPLSPDASPEQKFYYMLKKFAAFENTHPAPPEGEPEPEGAGILPRDDWSNDRFKMIPRLLEAPWIVKNAVPVKPAIMGKKLTCRYFRGDNYIELDLDVASEAIARNIVSLCRGYARQLVVDVGIVFQGENESELPERMLGVVSMHHIDLNFVMELH